MAIHDVEMDPVGPGLIHRADFLADLGKVGCEHGWGNEQRAHRLFPGVLSPREVTRQKGRGNAPDPAAGSFQLLFKSPSRTRLSAVATIASWFERGAQPSRRLALSLLALRTLPSCGTAGRTEGARRAARRTSQLGS